MDTHNINSALSTVMSLNGIKDIKKVNIKRSSETGEHYINFTDQSDRQFTLKIDIHHEEMIRDE